MERISIAMFNFLVLLLIISLDYSSCRNMTIGCVKEEREALMKFKESLSDPWHHLSSWNGNNCCSWKGVLCAQSTGHVVKLDLRYVNPLFLVPGLSGREVKSSLVELSYLNYLDLSGNDFQGSPIPKFFGSMKHLRYLNLSTANFSGIVPHHLGNLSGLRVLDLGYRQYFGIDNDLRVDNVKWISQLSSLQHLDLSGANLTGAEDLGKALYALPSMVKVLLYMCGLGNLHLSQAYVNSSLFNVQFLDLSYNSFEGEVPQFILNMTSVEVLDMSVNNFNFSILSLVELRSLAHLDLSVNLFNNIEMEFSTFLWNKCNLKTLDMRQNHLDGQLLRFQGNSSRCLRYDLEMLSLRNNKFTGPLPDKLGQLKHLRHLDLSWNYFTGAIPVSLGNLSALRELDLSYCQLSGSIPTSLGNLTALRSLDLSFNQFDSIEISTFLWNKCNLKTLDVSGNKLDGQLLRFHGNSSRCLRYDLEMLSLGGDEFIGPLPDNLGMFKHLKHLVMSRKYFTGAIPASLGNLSALRELDLSHCQLSGSIPTSLGNMTALRSLELNHNQLNGTLPISLGKLSNLETLDLSSNFLNGIITEGHFAKLAMLKHIDMSNNLLTFKVKSDWKPPFQLHRISMSSCKMEGGFPQWLQTQRGIHYLDFSNSSISGSLPKWINVMNLTNLDLSYNHTDGPILVLSSKLRNVDLSHNLFSGPLSHDIGDLMPHLESLLLAGNVLNGVIPNSLCKMKTLQFLDLSRNSFSGSIPDCWNDNNEELVVLELSSNRLSGSIPKSIGHLKLLRWLHLNNNSFSGEFPSALRNCSELIVLDIGENRFFGDLPKWVGTDLQNLTSLRLHNNMFTGTIPWEFCQLFKLQIMDLAGNNLTGNLPSCLGNLTSMAREPPYRLVWGFDDNYEEHMLQTMKGLEREYTKNLEFLVNLDLSNNNLVGGIPEGLTNLSRLLGLNLSHNILTGSIPPSIGNMKSLESLDLSHNHLSSEIPGSMSKLISLSHLNLSYNNFSGQIPTGPQLQTLDDPSIYVGNPELCGALLQKKCNTDDPSQSPPAARDHPEGKKTDDVLFYITVMTGFATGFWTVVAILVFKRSWRHSLFRFSDAAMERILLEITLKLGNLKH